MPCYSSSVGASDTSLTVKCPVFFVLFFTSLAWYSLTLLLCKHEPARQEVKPSSLSRSPFSSSPEIVWRFPSLLTPPFLQTLLAFHLSRLFLLPIYRISDTNRAAPEEPSESPLPPFYFVNEVPQRGVATKPRSNK